MIMVGVRQAPLLVFGQLAVHQRADAAACRRPRPPLMLLIRAQQVVALQEERAVFSAKKSRMAVRLTTEGSTSPGRSPRLMAAASAGGRGAARVPAQPHSSATEAR